MDFCEIVVLPDNRVIKVPFGANLKEVLLENGFVVDSPCGGKGFCGKCRVLRLLSGTTEEILACQMTVTENMTIALPEQGSTCIMTEGLPLTVEPDAGIQGLLSAVDIGTTTVVCYLLDGKGKELSVASMLNPQNPYGSDVISKIQAALEGKMSELTDQIRNGLTALIREVCEKARKSAEEIERISIVGNPCMQQLFFGILPDNLAKVPFSPVLTTFKNLPAKDYLPLIPNAVLQVVPDISGYVGADTLACVLSTEVYKRTEPFLLVDIGTNGEMVMGNGKRMLACSTAAGPALEGANIHFGMRGVPGAIDHVFWEEGKLKIHTIGDLPAKGICGSGLIDAAAVLLRIKAVNFRGRLAASSQMPELSAYLGEVSNERVFYLTDQIYLTQNDVRQLQLAKGAVGAGVELMAKTLEIEISDIQEVILAGAFGSYIRAESACAIGLLPPILLPRIYAVGNAAGSGAKRLVCNSSLPLIWCVILTFLNWPAFRNFRDSLPEISIFRNNEDFRKT